MALPPRAGYASQTGFPDMDEELATARDALLLFADAEDALASLVCAADDPACRYPDLAAVRSFATVDELLQLLARLPSADAEERGEEGSALYPALLELAEVFDILIDQYSLVYGDAVALAESIAPMWHAMAGCFNHMPTPPEATVAVKQIASNLAPLPGLLDKLSRLSAEGRQRVVERFACADARLWTAEARHLALHAVEVWMPHGVSEPRIARALQPVRVRPTSRREGDTGHQYARAVADLVLARLVREIASERVASSLEAPFSGLVPDARD